MADDTIIDGKIVTFYSFKGGTGRTMALANVAWILASNGLKVLVVDWDLDSPGLHRYFHPFLDPAKVAATPGIIELITEYAWDATEVADPPADWIRDYAQILPHAISVNWPFPEDGTLDFVSAGRQNRDYSSAATAVDWDNFYDRLGGGQFIDALRADMKAHYDYTLIDSRTGLSDIADICTVHLPDILVNCFTLNDQSIDGAAAIAKNLAQRYHYRNIQVLPVPMRIDEAEKDKADVGLAAAKARFGGLRAGTDRVRRERLLGRRADSLQAVLRVRGDARRLRRRAPVAAFAARRVRAADRRDHRRAGPRGRGDERGDAAHVQGRLHPSPAAAARRHLPQLRSRGPDVGGLDRRRARAEGHPRRAARERLGRRRQHPGGRGARRRERPAARSPSCRPPTCSRRRPEGVWDAMGAADPAGTSRRLIPIRVGETRLEQPFSERTVVDLTRRDASQATEELLKALGYPPRLADAIAGPTAAEPRYPRTIPPVWRVPTRNASFTGRNEVLEKLHDQLIGKSTAVVLPVALHGQGGVGKTQVAQEYAHRFMADYDLVWWVPSEQRDLINPSLAELAPHLGVRPADSTAETAEAVREALRRGRPYDRWLLIFDNVDEPGELEDFFPGGPGHVIVTSRNPAWSELAEPVAIDVFSRAESLDYLQRRVRSLSVEDATLVARELGDLPLAIEQAGAWLAATGMAAAEYVTQIRERFAATMELSQPTNYPTSVAVTYQLSFERLKSQSPAAARLLELCACFAPDPISLTLLSSDEMIKSLTPYDRRLRAARTVLGLLITDITRFSLAKVDREMTSNSIQVHRLVQAAIRDQMQPDSYREETMHEVHEVLAGARPRQGDTDDPGNWARYDLIWPHLGPSEVWNCDDEEARQLLIDRVRYLWKRGDYEDALEVAHKLEAQWQEKIGPDDEQTLSLRFHIANVLRSQGSFEAAHELDTEIFAKQQEALGDDHPSTLLTAGGLGGDLRGLGRFREALALDEATYSRNKDLLGPDDPNTLSSANNLAVDLRLVGDCFRARDLDRETRNYRQVVLGPDHPYTLHSASMLARDMREAGDYAGSVDLLRGDLRALSRRPRRGLRGHAAHRQEPGGVAQEGWSARRRVRADEGNRRPVRAELRGQSPGLARVQAEPGL